MYVKTEETVVLLESWKKPEKEQGMECCTSGFDVDHLERENRRAFEGVESSFGQLKCSL